MDEFTEHSSLVHSEITGNHEDIPSNDKEGNRNSFVLVLYTGGTIGMCSQNGSYRPVQNYMNKTIRRYPMLNDQNYLTEATKNTDMSYRMNKSADFRQSYFVMPGLANNCRIFYNIVEYSQLLDSSNCTFDNWVQIAHDVKSYFDDFDGFVILHGTDTMAFAASTLSFILENLSKPVIFTGSQIPIFEMRSDGRDNFVGALFLAGGGYDIPEVGLFFQNKLYRGCRSVKKSSVDFDAFDSPNFPPLAELGIDIIIHQSRIFHQPLNKRPLRVQNWLCRHVAILRIFPSITTRNVQEFFTGSLRGVVLQSYGAGNVPSARTDLMLLFKEATERGVLIVNTTQCYKGGVKAIYETGAALHECGVIPAFVRCKTLTRLQKLNFDLTDFILQDMTPEGALTKLAYILARFPDAEMAKQVFLKNLRGEITIPADLNPDFDVASYPEPQPIPREASIDTVSVTKELTEIASLYYGNVFYLQAPHQEWSRILLPKLFCEAAVKNDTHSLQLLSFHLDSFEGRDYNDQTALHLAAYHGNEDAVEFLTISGADLWAKDAKGRTPLMLAFSSANKISFKIVRCLGAFLPFASGETNCAPWSLEQRTKISNSLAAQGNIYKLRLLLGTGASLNVSTTFFFFLL
ncbi:hypothetical protein Ciccas_001605 [Cichlidogyrus casuarinus]|uniref:asparaginase n=1 Tax=Cichlidogyrus casuarinus TaxID=1844966 RepID=A0ABD2QJL9_9PLAT